MSATQEEIAAFADGELSGEDLARVERAVMSDPAIAAKVEAHRALKAKLGAHFAPVLDQPVPDRLTKLLASGDADAGDTGVVSFARERQKRDLAPFVRRWAPIAGPAMAASLVLVMWQPWQGSGGLEGYADDRLASALDTQLVAEQSPGATTRILLSFESYSGELCRAYRSGGAGGIACRDDSGWAIEREFALEEGQATEFRQAGSETDLLAAAQEMARGGALDAQAEAEAKTNGWR